MFWKWGKQKEKGSKKHAFAVHPLFVCRNVESFVVFIEVHEYPFSFFSLPTSRIIYFHFIQSLAWSWMLGIELTFSFCKVYIFKKLLAWFLSVMHCICVLTFLFNFAFSFFSLLVLLLLLYVTCFSIWQGLPFAFLFCQVNGIGSMGITNKYIIPRHNHLHYRWLCL